MELGDWRISESEAARLPQNSRHDIFSDTVGARALLHNAVDPSLHPGLLRGNLTVDSFVNPCNASGTEFPKI